ncbi:MAG TPA: polyphosphate polymerase domain-containing protein [Erysipelotrichaceae bacterium]|nr:polyphosphate polymerase domain-containing protein [Erysipelotrichaceae bacterium]
MVEYRYELKYVISKPIAEMLKNQLAAVMELDRNSKSEKYSYDVRSLYFDDAFSTSLDEKRDGIQFRSKYRIRIYNYSSRTIKLECKHKDIDMTYKEEVLLPLAAAIAICEGRFYQITSKNSFLNKFLANAQVRQLRPSVIVDYRRTAFAHPVSKTRITFDEYIRSGKYNYDLFDKDIETVPVTKPDEIVLEVKCNDFIPAHITAILNSVPKLRQAISKFAYCREVK